MILKKGTFFYFLVLNNKGWTLLISDSLCQGVKDDELHFGSYQSKAVGELPLIPPCKLLCVGSVSSAPNNSSFETSEPS